MTFDNILTNAGYFLLILNTLLFIISYSHKKKALKYLIIYLLLCVFIQLYSSFLASTKQHNLFLTHYFFIGQFVFLSFFFSTLYNFKKYKYITLVLTSLVTIYFATYLINNPKAYAKWNLLEIIITSIPLIIYSFYFFIKNINENNDKTYTYFNSGFFVYTLCSTLIFMLGNIGSIEIKRYVWLFNKVLYLFFQTLILIEWYKNFRKLLNFKLLKN